MMGPSHFGRGIGAESFGVDGFVRGFSFDAQSFVSLSLPFGAGSAHICSAQITRSVCIAAALHFGLVGHDAFGVAIDVCLAFRSRVILALPLKFFL